MQVTFSQFQSDKAFKDTVVNWALPSLHEGSLEITNIKLDFVLTSWTLKYVEIQGFNARKVISEVYASFVLQFTVTGR